MKNVSIFIVFVLIVLSVLYFFSRGDYSPLPADKDHAGITDYAVCMKCHPVESTGLNGAGGQRKEYALKDSHPPKYECLKCHVRQKQ